MLYLSPSKKLGIPNLKKQLFLGMWNKTHSLYRRISIIDIYNTCLHLLHNYVLLTICVTYITYSRLSSARITTFLHAVLAEEGISEVKPKACLRARES